MVNLLENHAQTFRRRLWSAVMLYSVVIVTAVAWGGYRVQAITQQSRLLSAQIKEQPPLTIKKKDTQTMEHIKTQLSTLFALPLSGISFSVLSLNEEGMRVRGQARTADALETWLGQVSEAFTVERHASQTTVSRGLVFEVLLNEKQ